MSEPYLSIVIAVRNDNYGGDFTQRLQKSLNWNTRLLERYAIDAEIIMVNWNPLLEEVSLVDQLDWPTDRRYVKYRMINVPSELHDKYIDPSIRDTVPMFEFIAKNTGVRRAKGEYVLSTNADILIHPEIFKAIGHGKLNPEYYYRANRLDFRKTEKDSVSQMFRNGLSIMLKGKGYYLSSSRLNWLQYEWLRFRNALWLEWEAIKLRYVDLSNRWRFNVVHDNGSLMAHCHCSGDFMLMKRQHWFTLKAYPEYTYTVMHKDSMLTILAFSFLKEKIFSNPIFHQDHQRRYGWKLNSHDEKYDRAYEFFLKMAHQVRENRPIDEFLNDENWGLANFQLEEQQV